MGMLSKVRDAGLQSWTLLMSSCVTYQVTPLYPDLLFCEKRAGLSWVVYSLRHISV